MKRKLFKTFLCGILIVLVIALAGCTGQNGKTKSPELTLEVALYQYVSDYARFQQAVRDVWQREHPDTGLHFVDWDCYRSDLDPNLDVFVYDAIYLSSFAEEEYLLPIPEEMIRDREDLLPFALEGCFSGGKLYALPQLVCTNLLFTRKEDSALSEVSDLITLYEILGDRKTQTVIPEENEGLLIDLSDVPLTKTVMYLDALMDEQHVYTDYSQLPAASDLSEQAVERLLDIEKMGGSGQVSYWAEEDEPFVRARWFAEGKGRAFIGFAEAMSAMGDYAENVLVRRFSYGPGKDIPLFYTDVVSVNSAISEEKKALALELANILISEEVLETMSLPEKEGDSPQYVLPARKSVYDALGEHYPIYSRLKEIADSPENHVFRIGTHARQFITEMGEALFAQLDQRLSNGES